MIAFIDEHRGAYGLEPRSGSRPICRMLPIAPSIYHEHVARRGDPSRMPARAKRDAELRREVQRVFEENLRVYGVRKMWHQLRREGFQVARWVVLQASKDWCGRVHCCNPDQCRFQTSPVTPPGCPWREGPWLRGARACCHDQQREAAAMLRGPAASETTQFQVGDGTWADVRNKAAALQPRIKEQRQPGPLAPVAASIAVRSPWPAGWLAATPSDPGW